MNKFLKNKSDIIAWLDQYNITNYELIENDKYGYVAHVDSDVDLSGKSLKYMPIKFGNINGSFSCYNNNLTSLEFGPTKVDGSFNCGNNRLTSLEFCPATVDGYFDCSSNNLTSLKGCPTTINGDFYCYNNKLSSLQFCPVTIGGGFYCNNNNLTDLIYFPNHINGNIYLGNNNLIDISKDIFTSHNFKEISKIHLEYKIKVEKKLLDDSISQNDERSPTKIKI